MAEDSKVDNEHEDENECDNRCTFRRQLVSGLGDRHASVQRPMLDAALAIVDCHGQELMSSLLPILEDFLEKAPNTQSFDVVRQGVVVVLGTMAKHLDKGLKYGYIEDLSKR